MFDKLKQSIFQGLLKDAPKQELIQELLTDSTKDEIALQIKRFLPRYTADDDTFDDGTNNTDYNYPLLNLAFQENTWVNAGVNARANALSAVPLKVFERVKNDGVVTAEEVTDPNHSLVKILRNPSPTMSGKELIRRSAGFYSLDGESIWLARHAGNEELKPTTGEPNGVDLLESRFIDNDGIIVGRFGTILFYTYETSSGKLIKIPSILITHAKNFNPFSHTRGLPVIQVERQAITLMFHMLRYNLEFFQNDATPAGILTAKGVMDKFARETNLKWWNKAHRGVGKSHKIAVLDEEMTFQSIGESNKDAQFPELYNIAREQILSTLGVPPVIVGLLEELNLANSREQKRIFYENTVMPMGEAITDSINNQFVEVWYSGQNLFVQFDWASVEALQFDRKTGAEIDNIYLRAGVLNPDEVRETLNKPPRDDGEGDVYLVQPTTTTSSSEGSADESSTKAGRGTRIKATQLPTRVDQWRARAFGQEKGIAQLNRAMRKFFRAQLDRILTALQEQSKSVPSPTKLKISNTDLMALFDIGVENELIADAAAPVLKSIAKQAGDSAINDLVSGISFNVADPLVVDALAAKIPNIQGVNEKMQEALSKILVDAGENNLTVQQTSQRIRAKWADLGSGRALTIARTETIGAQNIATEGAFGQSGVVTAKEWLSSKDSDVRDSHTSSGVDGEKVPLNSRFSNGVDVPGGSGPASEVVNCRCTLLAVLED